MLYTSARKQVAEGVEMMGSVTEREAMWGLRDGMVCVTECEIRDEIMK